MDDLSSGSRLVTHAAEDLRCEYAAIASYLQATVTNRFTTAALYITASGFLAAAAFKVDTLGKLLHVLICLFGCLISFCVWLLELRTRQLLFDLVKRGKFIEQKHWKL